MVGGSSPSRGRGAGLARPAPSALDFEEALGDEAPMELWTRQLRGSFQRSVLAFPPKPRSGCTWTALGKGRLLLLGGRSQGRCLADVHILQLQGPKMPSKTDRSPKSEDQNREDSDSEAEAIFIASEYRASGKPPKAQRSPQEMVKRRGSDSETDSEEEPERSKMSSCVRRAMPCSTQEVLAMASQVKMTIAREDVPKGLQPAQSRRKSGGDDFPEARWRQPQALEEHTPPRPRAGHSAVLQVPVLCGETPAVLVYGGLGDGGLPLGDTYELRILETEDQSLEFVWSLLDAGGKEHCETAPWEQQSAPRPRACHSAVFWSGSQRSMVIFGGLGMGLEGEAKAQGDCWLYTIVSQRSAQQAQAVGGWKRPTLTGGAPARRWGHGACMVGDAMLICGGMDATGELGDCWLLQLQSMRWEQLETSLQRAPKELGRCQALWSSSEQAAVIWSCHGSWCFVPGKEPEKEKSIEASPWSSKFPKPDDLRLPLADAMAPALAVGTPKASLPPVRAGPWKACHGEAEAFHQSWPQQVTPRKEKRPVNSAVGRERPRKASREVREVREVRELGPVKPPRARPPMKC